MVDSTSGIGQIQNVSSTNRTQQNTQNRRSEESEDTQRAAPTDEVEISEDAINLAQAEQAASDVRSTLEQDETQTLGLNPDFAEDA